MAKKNIIRTAPLIPNAGIASDYANAIAAIVKAMADDVKKEMIEAFKENPIPVSGAMDASIASQARIRLNSLNDKWKSIFSRFAKRIVTRMISRTLRNADATVNMSLKDLSAELTIDTSTIPVALKEIIKATTEESANLIRLIPQEYLADVQGAVMRSITSGNGLQDLVPYMNTRYEQRTRHARNVALDQTRKAYNGMARARMQSIGLKKFEWLHSGGGQEPRPLHVKLSRQIFSFDDPPYIGDMYGQPVYGFPGELPNCFTGDHKFQFTNRCNKLFRRRYTGKLISIITDNGVILKATPNHPILTGNGWAAIDRIQVGDYIFNAGRQSIYSGEANETNNIPEISDLFDALLSIMGASRQITRPSAFEFHGDISDGEISIIDVDSCLPSEFDTEFCKQLCEFMLSWSDDSAERLNLFGYGAPHKLVMRMFHATNSVMRRLCALLALFGSHSRHAGDARLGLSSYLTSRFNESLSDCAARNSILLGKLKFAQPGDIGIHYFGVGQFLAAIGRALDCWDGMAGFAYGGGKIVGVTSKIGGDFFDTEIISEHRDRVVDKFVCEDFSGHVYNLETVDGWYLSNGIISHNCKCSLRPVLEFDDEY